MAPSRWRGRTSDREEFRTPHRPAYRSSSRYTMRSLQDGRRGATSELFRDNDTRPSHTPRQPESSSPAMNLSNLDRNFWERRTRFPTEGNLTIGRVLTCLGLKRKSSNKRGIVSFENKGVGELADAVALVASRLPIDAPKFVDIAAQPGLMMAIVENLLERFGMQVWGPELHREWLIQPGEAEGYARELRYEDEDDHPALKEYLRLWILVKGVNAIMYTKSKKPATKSRSPRRSSAGWNPHVLPTYNRAFWKHELETPKPTLNIPSIVDTLGLEHCLTRRGPTRLYTGADGEELESAIVAVANTLWKDETGLLEIATAPEKLHSRVDALLLQFGEKLWGERRAKSLVYSNLHDRTALRHYVRLWIIVQAFSSFKSSASSQHRTEGSSSCQGIGRDLDGEVEESRSNDEDGHGRQLRPDAIWVSLAPGYRQRKGFESPVPVDKSARPPAESTRSCMTGSDQNEPSLERQGHIDTDLQKNSSFVPAVTLITAPRFVEQGRRSSPMAIDDEDEPGHNRQRDTLEDATSLVDGDNIIVKPKSREVVEIPAERTTKPIPPPLFADQDSPKVSNDDNEHRRGNSPSDELALNSDHVEAASNTNQQGSVREQERAAGDVEIPSAPTNVPSAAAAIEVDIIAPEAPSRKSQSPPTQPEQSVNIAVKERVLRKDVLSIVQTKGSLDVLAAEPAPETIESPRTTRSTRRTAVRTYNEAILSGRARHTPTKYLEKHHKNVLHDPTDRTQSRKRTVSKFAGDHVAPQHVTKRQKSSDSPGYALTNAFLDYFKSDIKNLVQETSLLDDIEHKLTAFASSLSSESSFLAIVTAWLKLCRTIMSVQQRVPTAADFAVSQGHVKITRSRMLTELRVARDAFVAVHGDEVRTNETIMAEVLGKMQGSPAERKEVKATVQQGLKRCNERLFELGEELGSGKWVLMG